MKKYFLIFILFCVPILLKAENFHIDIVDHSNYFEVQLQTMKNYPVCHYLKPSELFLEAPQGTIAGRISMYIESDAKVMPLVKPGPDVGCVEFGKGICLPKIDIGQYELIINNEYYGLIYVKHHETYFKSFFEL